MAKLLIDKRCLVHRRLREFAAKAVGYGLRAKALIFWEKSLSMATFMDSAPVFEQRLQACDVPASAIDALQKVGVTTLSKLAFCSSYSPSMPDDKPLMDFFNQTIDPQGQGLNAGILSALRRAFFEAHTFMLNDLRSKIDKREDEAPRKVPQAERNARLEAQRRRLAGIEIAGPLEPSDSLVDLVAQQKEDEILRYVELEVCTCRESEVRTARTSKTNRADLGSDFLVRQALQRRALAYDQMEIMPFQYLESWNTYLFNLMIREPLQVDGVKYNRVSLTQVLEADRQAFALASDRCRKGIQVSAGKYPAVEAFDLARADPLVISLLQPLPAGRTSSFEGQREAKTSRTRVGEKGSGKGGGKRNGKGKQGSKGIAPKELIGLHLRTKSNEPICFAYNISECKQASDGKRCSKGFHVCAKCLGQHSKLACKNS